MSLARTTSSRLERLVEGLLAGVLLAALEGAWGQWPLLAGTTMRFDPAVPVLAAGLYGLLGGLAALGGRWGAVTALGGVTVGACLWSGEPGDAAVRAVMAPLATGLAHLALRQPRVLIALAAVGLVLPWVLPGETHPEGRSSRPDIVLVVLDTVAAKRTSLHGAPEPNTPTLEHLAAEGVDFRSAISASPWTIPAHATLFTGRLPRETGCHFERPLLDDNLPTTAELLAASGYRTGLFAANPWLEPSTGLARGFAAVHSQGLYARSFWAYSLFRWVPEAPYKGGPIVVREALRWLQEGGEAPSFAVLNLMEAHAPYHLVVDPDRFGAQDLEAVGERVFEAQTKGWWATGFPASEAEQQDAVRLYAAAIAAVDDQLAALVEGLASTGHLEQTWLIVTSDHGEAFGEHGVQGHLVGLWEELLHVPLVVHGPGLAPGVVEEVVSLQAIQPTVLSLAGVGETPSLVPWPPPPPRGEGLGWPGTGPGVAISEQFRPELMWAPGLWGTEAIGNRWDQRALRVRIGSHVLLEETPGATAGPSRRTAYDLARDPGERQPLAASQPGSPERAALVHLLESVRAVPDAAIGREDPELEAGLRARLAALGYLDHGD